MSLLHDLLSLFHTLTDPDWISQHGGLYIVMFIIFAETGLFVGFFLPGDSLLFITGMIISNTTEANPTSNTIVNLLYWIIIISIAGIIGNVVGYWFGNKSGHLLMKRPDSWIFKKKHLHDAHEFYEKKGGLAIILARFLPIVRTFAPIVAGMAEMTYKKFMSFNIIGSFVWVIVMLLLGFALGKNEMVKDNLEKVTILIILLTTGPVLLKMFFRKKKTASTP
jgi:membrane-associated protein